MLIIEVTNAREVVRKQVGRLGERLIGKVADPEFQVEKALIQEMENAFHDFGIEAKIFSVKDLRIDDEKSLSVQLNIREERDILLKDE